MSLTFERKLPIVLTFVFFMLTTVGIFSYQSTISIREELHRQRRTREVVRGLDAIVTSSVETDNALFSFIATGNETYLDPATRAERTIPEQLSIVQNSMVDDPQQVSELKNIRDLLAQRLSLTKQLIDLRRQTDFQTAANQIPLSSSRTNGNELRAAIDRLKNRELGLLGVHESDTDAGMNRTILILIVSSLAGVVALVLANFIVIIENNRRRTAEVALRQANEELEEKVEARTAELQTVNETLLESASEREQLLAKEKEARKEAEIANRLRDEFMATVSHELRTPLNSILGWARLLRDGNLDTRQSSRAVKTIVKNSESQNRLIEDLLDVARMISGKLQLEVADVPVREFVEHSVETAKPEAAKRNITIDLDIQDGAREGVISGDKVRLEQIVGNLLTNAIKFSKPDSRVDVKAFGDSDFVEIDVTDRGAGISKEFLPLVFERFRQDRSTIKESGGLGLGLAVVRNLTELHGGTVNALSEGENKGSTFVVRLPLVKNGKG